MYSFWGLFQHYMDIGSANLKEFMPARKIPASTFLFPLGSVGFHNKRSIFKIDFGIRLFIIYCSGNKLLFRQRATLASPITPAAVSACPTFPTEPRIQNCFLSVAGFVKDSTSMDPKDVPVPWAQHNLPFQGQFRITVSAPDYLGLSFHTRSYESDFLITVIIDGRTFDNRIYIVVIPWHPSAFLTPGPTHWKIQFLCFASKGRQCLSGENIIPSS